MDNATIVQIVVGGIISIIVWTFKSVIQRSQKLTDSKLDKVVLEVENLTKFVHTIKEELVEKVNDNKLYVKDIDKKVEMQQVKIDEHEKKIEKLFDIMDDIRGRK